MITFIVGIIVFCIEGHLIVNGELFTATADLEVLHDAQAVFLTNLKKYIAEHEKKLDHLEKYIDFYDYHHDIASADVSDYLSSPINAYLMTKRLTADWKNVEATLTYDVAYDIIQNITEQKKLMKSPTLDDLHGAALALARLQSTYNLKATDMANGILGGVKYSNHLMAADCFDIGYHLFLAKDYRYALSWLIEAKNRLANEPQYDQYLTINILSFLSFAHQRSGNTLESFTVSNELLQNYPISGLEALENLHKNTYEQSYNDLVENLTIADIGQPLEIKPLSYDIYQKIRYEKLCRRDIVLTPKQMAPLRCRYVTNNSPFLRIAPLKLEEVSLDPYIVTYVDALYDTEIEKIKELAQPKLERAKVQATKQTEKSLTNHRTSKSTWLDGSDHRLIRNIELRVEDMCGLTESTAEQLQVVNYGIGGQYEPHFDFALPGDDITFAPFGTGNRIATVLFYMTDVEQGGATVFPYLNLALWPKKGSAAVWYNLFRSGEGDFRTHHASCPVLVGQKWICNKWFHEKDQSQFRPCLLEPDHTQFSELYADIRNKLSGN